MAAILKPEGRFTLHSRASLCPCKPTFPTRTQISATCPCTGRRASLTLLTPCPFPLPSFARRYPPAGFSGRQVMRTSTSP